MHAAPSVTAWWFRATALIAGKELHSNPLNSVHDQRTVLYGGRGILAWAARSAADQRSRRSWKYGSPGSIRKLSSASQTSRRAINTSIGRPTLRFERMVESTETSPTLSAS